MKHALRLLFVLTLVAPGAKAQDYSSLSGGELFHRFCASCHGTTAQGDGTVAPVLRITPPDLTEIAKRHGGEFPESKVYQIIDGRVPTAAHGTREMPVWGTELWRAQGYDIEAGRKTVLIIDKLIGYLKSIQKPQRAPEPSGSAQPPASGKEQG
jgi:mono/diheme cytochrome c family protein